MTAEEFRHRCARLENGLVASDAGRGDPGALRAEYAALRAALPGLDDSDGRLAWLLDEVGDYVELLSAGRDEAEPPRT